MDKKIFVDGWSLTSLSVLVGIVFVVLKLCNIITWDWFNVCIPFIVAAGLVILNFILTIIAIIIYFFNTRW